MSYLHIFTRLKTDEKDSIYLYDDVLYHNIEWADLPNLIAEIEKHSEILQIKTPAYDYWYNG